MLTTILVLLKWYILTNLIVFVCRWVIRKPDRTELLRSYLVDDFSEEDYAECSKNQLRLISLYGLAVFLVTIAFTFLPACLLTNFSSEENEE